MKNTLQALAQETPQERWRRLAYHEAGHATAALCSMRDYVVGLSLGETEQDAYATSGRMHLVARPDGIADPHAFAAADAVVTCAGRQGERIAYGYNDPLASTLDLQMLRNIVILAIYEIHRRSRKALSAESLARALEERIKFVIMDGYAKARAILLRERILFQAIADELLAEGHVSRDRLLTLHRCLAVAP